MSRRKGRHHVLLLLLMLHHVIWRKLLLRSRCQRCMVHLRRRSGVGRWRFRRQWRVQFPGGCNARRVWRLFLVPHTIVLRYHLRPGVMVSLLSWLSLLVLPTLHMNDRRCMLLTLHVYNRRCILHANWIVLKTYIWKYRPMTVPAHDRHIDSWRLRRRRS